jgi:serine/threonine protein kinase
MTARDLRGELPLGTVLGEAYRLTRRIADGGMGTVYEAEHLRLGKRCAVKVLARDLAASGEALARFHREVEITSQLNHPHIVQVMDFGTAPGGEPFLVMEYLDGEDLAQRLRRMGRVTPAAACHIVKQVASALAATHAGGIVHRDLKPANIFLIAIAGAGEAESNFVKVVDFGISKVIHAAPGLTRASVLMGTPHYMPPEQATGRIENIDQRSDQWGLACIAWEMLVGRVPFSGKDVTALLFQIVHEDPLPAAARADNLTAPVFEVLARALSKRQGDRFPSITAFARAFEAAVTTPAPGAAPVVPQPSKGSGTVRTKVPTPPAVSRSPWRLATIFVPRSGGGGARPLAALGQRFRATVFKSLRTVTPFGQRKSPLKTLMERVTPEVLRPRRRRRWYLWGLAACLLIAGGVLAARAWMRRAPDAVAAARDGQTPGVAPAAGAGSLLTAPAAAATARRSKTVSWASLQRQLRPAICVLETRARTDKTVQRQAGFGKASCRGVPARTPVQKAIVEAFNDAGVALTNIRPAGQPAALALPSPKQRQRRLAEVMLADAEFRQTLLFHLRAALARHGVACSDCPAPPALGQAASP